MQNSKVIPLTCLLSLLLLCGCGDSATKVSVVVVYSPHGKLLPGVKQRFEAAHPGTTVQFLDLGGGTIFDRVKAEKDAPGAEVWFGGSPADFKRADTLGLLEAYSPEWAKTALPADAKSPTGGWCATFRTPECILYSKTKVAPADVPKTWDDLIDPKWKGRIVIRDVRASATMKTIFGAMILREQKRTGNVEAGFDWLKKLDANTGTYAANPALMFDLLAGNGPYAATVWNLPDAQQQVTEGKPMAYVVPEQTPVPVEPIAILKNCKNLAGAKLFYEYVNSPAELLLLAKEWHRIPARTDLPKEKLPEWMRELNIRAMDVDWDAMDKNVEEWIARWDTQIKGQNK